MTAPPLVVLLGPTAVGKTALSLGLCERFGAEVIGADSRQIYQGMDIVKKIETYGSGNGKTSK